MSRANKIDRKTKLRSGFLRDRRGNVATMFAFAILPILGFVGAAVDYSRAAKARTAMQAALDATALMIAKDAASMTPAQISSKAQAYFQAQYNVPEAPSANFSAVYTPNTGSGATVVVSATGTIQTDFMKLAGYPNIDFKSGSTTTWGNTRLRVALALDVTGSMNDDGKLGAMKTSAKKLIDTLRSSAQGTEDVFVSIIPFAQMVNVGSGNKNASWLDWDEDYGSCSNNTYSKKSSCVAAGRTWTMDNSNWRGCVTDRDQPYDTTKDVPTTANASTLFMAQRYTQNGSNICPSPILPMTSIYALSDAQTVKDKIDALVANGGTNQPIGMHWAWLSLQQASAPLTAPAKDNNYKYSDVIILLSDGLNTIDRWYGNGSSPSAQVDARQKILCDNIKNPANGKTTIYTIQVNTDGDPESAILKSCADTGQFYPTTTTSGIDNAFNQIGASLTKLKLAK
ncbi:MAG: pilus assembly protein TadG [Proteobacteria bacterium SG_bin9]|nr:MAG: pilus assembly protein TadG [Proteobacteria bacterium SG_bin9]